MAVLKRKAKGTKAEAETTVKEAKITNSKDTDAEFDREYPFGIAHLTDACGSDDPRNIRRWLRSAEIEKAGKRYGWKTQEEIDELAKEFKTRVRKSPGKPKTKKEAEVEADDEIEEADDFEDDDEAEEVVEEKPAPKKPAPKKKAIKKKLEPLVE